MKVIASLLSISLTAITMLPAAAANTVDSSDRASWIELTLAAQQGAAKKTPSSTSITTTSSSSLAHSVSQLYTGVKMRPFVANRYLPSERDIEAAQQAQQAQQAQVAQLPASTVQLAKAMATTQAMNVQQRQLQGNVAYSGSYYNNMSSTQVRPRAASLQGRLNSLNALAPSIPEPISNNETIGQIRTSLRNNGGQMIASASTGSPNLYPDVVGPVPTQATANTAKTVPSPLSFLSQRSTRQYASNGNRVAATSNSALTPSPFGGWKTNTNTTQSKQGKSANLSYSGFQSYTGKLHINGTTSARSNGQTQTSKTAYTSSLPAADCNIASAADCYSTATSHYTPYVSSQSSTLPY